MSKHLVLDWFFFFLTASFYVYLIPFGGKDRGGRGKGREGEVRKKFLFPSRKKAKLFLPWYTRHFTISCLYCRPTIIHIKQRRYLKRKYTFLRKVDCTSGKVELKQWLWLHKFNNGSHRKETASKRVIYFTCVSDSSRWWPLRGVLKENQRQSRGEAGEQSRHMQRQDNSLRAAASSQQRIVLGGESGRGAWEMRLLHLSTSLHLSLFPGKLLIVLQEAGQMLPLLGILHCCMLHTPSINTVTTCVARSPTWGLCICTLGVRQVW